jgi:hypothetical protein
VEGMEFKSFESTRKRKKEGRKQKGFILAELFGMKKFMIPVYTYGWEKDSSMGNPERTVEY